MKASTATVTAAAVWLAFSSACGRSFLIDGSSQTEPGDGGSVGSSGATTEPATTGTGEPGSEDASVNPPVSEAGAGQETPDSTSGTDEDAFADVANDSAGDAGLGPGFATLATCGFYTQVDPHNCGTCGHDCGGGACEDGACVPLPPGVLASGLVAPTSIAVDATNVYWLSEGVHDVGAGPLSAGVVQVMKCAKTGCNNSPTVLVQVAVDSTLEKDALPGLTVDATNVYWTTVLSLYSCAIGGCNNSPTVLRALPNGGSPAPWNISVVANKVYATASNNGGVYSCLTSGCNDMDAGGLNFLWQGVSAGVITDSTTAYWSSYGGVLSCALGGCNGTPNLLATPDATVRSIGQMAVDANDVYWTQGAPSGFETVNGSGFGYVAIDTPLGAHQNVYRCAKNGCNNAPTSLVGAMLENPLGLATDGTNVYFTELGDGMAANATNVGRVAKCAVAGCPGGATTIAGQLENPRGVAVDATSVYWADFGSGTLDSNALSTNQQSLLAVDGRIMRSTK
jgi:hypothetical protein